MKKAKINYVPYTKNKKGETVEEFYYTKLPEDLCNNYNLKLSSRMVLMSILTLISKSKYIYNMDKSLPFTDKDIYTSVGIDPKTFKNSLNELESNGYITINEDDEYIINLDVLEKDLDPIKKELKNMTLKKKFNSGRIKEINLFISKNNELIEAYEYMGKPTDKLKLENSSLEEELEKLGGEIEESSIPEQTDEVEETTSNDDLEKQFENVQQLDETSPIPEQTDEDDFDPYSLLSDKSHDEIELEKRNKIMNTPISKEDSEKVKEKWAEFGQELAQNLPFDDKSDTNTNTVDEVIKSA